METVSPISPKENGERDKSYQNIRKDNAPTEYNNGNADAKKKEGLIEWLNGICPDVALSAQASDEELRSSLIDGSVFSQILKRLRPSYISEGGSFDLPSTPNAGRVKRFLAALGEMGIPRFELMDLEKGSMKPVIECLLSLNARFIPNVDGERRRVLSDTKLHRSLRSPVMPDPSAALIHHVGLKFHEVFQLRQGRYADLPAAKISEMMKSNSLDNAPTQSLLSVVNGILDESVERKNGEIPHRVACLLRKVVQEIERRISTQAEHLRTQNNLFKAREEKYQSRIKVLEALATGTCETEIFRDQLQQTQTDRTKIEAKRKVEEGLSKMIKEEDGNNLDILALKQELEVAKKTCELRCLQMETEAKASKIEFAERMKDKEAEAKASKMELEEKIKEKETETKALKMLLHERTEEKETGASAYKMALEEMIKEKERETEASKMALEEIIKEKERETKASKMALEEMIKEKEREAVASKMALEKMIKEKETEAKASKMALEDRIRELEHHLAEYEKKVKELETILESINQKWNNKDNHLQSFVEFQFCALQELRGSSKTIKHEVLIAQKHHSDELRLIEVKLKSLADAAENYHTVLAENRRLFNEIQDLKGNIRVYCRARPFLPGQSGKQTIIEHAGDDGELTVTNPSKQGKEGRRLFKFNKVYGPAASQVEVYSDIQPFIRSVLDGYNVCIFAYGQTGSGKTYTMTGPNGATKETWGVNYRALNDLFQISETRKSFIIYEILVQMIEIYNEQVRDLLSSDGSQRKLGVSSISQPSGLAVPDATMLPVKATSDVLELMDIGFKNRAVSATALNERSSRSHSVITVHVRGKDLKTGSTSCASLHLVDLAGSERVDRSEVTGDRLKEAQYINKSLSALGDVIFALAQKSPHVPYRNSKLTQVLQTSLGGQAKTLMFVQLNPDVVSYTESLSTLKFAERVSGVELGAAKSSKDGRDVRELMEQVASLKDTIARKDEEIERLQLLKDLKNVYPVVEKRGVASSRNGSSSPSRNLAKGVGLNDRTATDPNNSLENSDKQSEDSVQGETLNDRYADRDYEERMSDHSDSSTEITLPSGGTEQPENLEKPKPVPKISRPLHRSASRESLREPTSARKNATGTSPLLKPSRRWQ